ncbi:DUF6124 family protein [Pseudomonas sp. P5_A2_2]
MASCAWEGLGPAGFPFPGRPTCVRFATLLLGRSDGELAHACESLASASVMASDFAGFLEGSQRNTMLGIAHVIMLGELAVNRALDNLDPQD